MIESAHLTVSELSEQVFRKLHTDHRGSHIIRKQPVLVELMTDNEDGQVVCQPMYYQCFSLIHLDGKSWVICLGSAAEQYYQSDLTALPCHNGHQDDTGFLRDIREILGACRTLNCSLFSGLQDNALSTTPLSLYSDWLRPILEAHLGRFMAQHDCRHVDIGSEMRELVRQPILYRTELVPFLAQAIIQVLEKASHAESEE